MKHAVPKIIFLIILVFGVMVVRAHAAPIASPTASDSAMTIIKQTIKQRADTAGNTAAPKQVKFGIIGTLDKIVGSTLQIQTPRGIVHLAELDHGAIILKGQKPITREDIELNIPVIAIGFKQKDDTLLIRRLIMADETVFGMKRATMYGKVQTNTAKALMISTFQDGSPSALSVKLGAKTSYLNSLGDNIKRTDIKVSDPVIAVYPDESVDASASALRVYSLSAQAIPTPTVAPVPGL